MSKDNMKLVKDDKLSEGLKGAFELMNTFDAEGNPICDRSGIDRSKTRSGSNQVVECIPPGKPSFFVSLSPEEQKKYLETVEARLQAAEKCLLEAMRKDYPYLSPPYRCCEDLDGN